MPLSAKIYDDFQIYGLGWEMYMCIQMLQVMHEQAFCSWCGEQKVWVQLLIEGGFY